MPSTWGVGLSDLPGVSKECEQLPLSIFFLGYIAFLAFYL